jgi:TPR repeat protein
MLKHSLAHVLRLVLTSVLAIALAIPYALAFVDGRLRPVRLIDLAYERHPDWTQFIMSFGWIGIFVLVGAARKDWRRLLLEFNGWREGRGSHNLDVNGPETKRRYIQLIPVIAGIAGALTAVLMIFPPWKETLDIPYRLHSQRVLGWSWIWYPPAPNSLRASIAVDWERLRLEVMALWVLVAPILLGIRYYKAISRARFRGQTDQGQGSFQGRELPKDDARDRRESSPKSGCESCADTSGAQALVAHGRSHLRDSEEAEGWLRKGLELQKAAPEGLRPELQMTLEYIRRVLAGTRPDVAAKNLGMTPADQEKAHVAHRLMPDTLKECVQLEEERNNQLLEAFRCFERGIQLDPDHPLLQYNIGIAYYLGRGVAQDCSEGCVWFRKAAGQGDANAEYCLGVAYSNGEGVPEDPAQAAMWLRKAAEQGNTDAQVSLGFAYKGGVGVQQDYVQAAVWLRRAAESGEILARDELRNHVDIYGPLKPGGS